MKQTWKKMLSLAMSAALVLGMTVTAQAWKYPSAYWKLHSAWETATEAQNVADTLSVAQKTWDLLRKEGLVEDVCLNLEPKAALASWLCEMKGDIDGALLWLDREEECATWLHNNGRNYKDTFFNIESRRAYLQAAKSMNIYVQTDEKGPDYTASGAAASGTLLGSVAGGSREQESAVLEYIMFDDGYSVDYWLGYFKNHHPKFRDAIQNGGVVELAWNFDPQSTAGAQKVLDADSYIQEGVAALGQLNATVLLRVGAEMNNWSDLNADTFIQAFRKVADAASAYPNIQMVFSPDNVSNRNVKFTDFYPGDAYVDWIGVSTYHNTNYSGSSPEYAYGAGAYGNDAYYGRGLYDSDPLVIIKPMVDFAKAHNKPMMISECGFSGTNRSTGIDQTVFAVDQMTKFYSYVNMIYPQVKAVFYFDNTLPYGDYPYALAENQTLSDTYEAVIRDNGGYLKDGADSAKVWKALGGRSVKGDSVRMATYASFPGKGQTTVTYYLDGKQVKATSQAPYYLDLDLSSLKPGEHTLKADAVKGSFRRSVSGTFTLKGDGLPYYEASQWAVPLLKEAAQSGLITDRTGSGFQTKITRLQFAELAVNLIEKTTGQAIVPAEDNFRDTDDLVVLKAVAAKVTGGTSADTFSPNDSITREQICLMLKAAIAYVDQTMGTDTLTNKSTQVDPKFQDADQISSWARDGVALITNNGLMTGTDTGVAPLDNTTVEQAIILIRALNAKF